MRRFPAGVAVATVELDGERLGLTLGSVVSLSLEPPLVGVSISRGAAIHEYLRRSDGFALSLLGEGQAALAQHFARGAPPLIAWVGIAMRAGSVAPLLAEALGWLECRHWAAFDTGDHTFFIGQVVHVEVGSLDAPLLYLDGAYTGL